MKQTLLKSWLMLVLLLVGVGSAWADKVSWTSSEAGYANQEQVSSVNPNKYISFTLDKGSNSNAPKYFTSGTAVRCYGGNTITVSATDATITDITFTFGASDGSNAITADVGKFTSPNWSGSANSVVFTIGGTTGNRRISGISVTYSTTGGDDPAPTTYTVTVANDIANGTVTASPTSAAAGATVTLTATPSDGYEFGSWNVTNASTSVAITVNDNKFTMPAANVNVSATFNAIQGGGDEPSGEGSWTKCSISDLTSSDIFVIVDAYSGTAMTNNNGTGSAPSAASVTISEDGNTITDVTDVMKWNISGDASNGYTFYPNGSTTTWLYCTATNNGVRVGTNTAKTFSLDGKHLKHAGTSRYVGVYDSQDWRCYTSSGGNIANTDTKFYKYVVGGGDTPDPDKTLVSIAATGTPATFWKGDAFNHEGITVTATWSDDTQTDVTSSCEFSGYDMSTAGAQTVTVTYEEKTATYGINVKTIANTQETAYTVAEAKALIDAGKDLATEVYVAGTISQIVTEFSSSYGNISFNVSADGETTGDQLQFFRNFKGADKQKWTDEDTKPAVGDEVIGFGKLTKYNSTYEFAEGNYVVSLTHPAAKTITALAVSGTPTKTTYNVGDAFETAGLVVTATYDDGTTAPITTGFDWEIDYGTGNEALVAGATSVDVVVYANEVMSEVYTVNGLTVNVPVTLTSIAVSGTPTKTEYYAGDAFDPAGLVVTGHYSDGSEKTITEGIEWTTDPEALALETTSIDVKAGVGSVVSDPYTVEGLTVTENPYKTATKSAFSTVSAPINEDISYEAFKGNAGTAPALPSGTTYIRLYQNGGYITIKGVKGVHISQASITTGATYESTTIGYACDDDAAPTSGESVAKNATYTVNDLDCNSISFYCLGTDSKSRIDVAELSVKYTKEVVELDHISLSGTYATEFVQNSTFNHNGAVVTATYTDNDTQDVTSSAIFSEPDLSTTGTKTVTVTYTEGATTKEATYDITVNAEEVTSIKLSGDYQTVFKAGDVFNYDNLIVKVDYNSGRKDVDVTVDAEVSEPNMSGLGEQTVTVSYNGMSQDYTIKVIPTNAVFYESFDSNKGTGGNDNQWSGSIASNTLTADNGWVFAQGGGANMCAKFGTGSNQGSATTPELGCEGAAIMTFKSAAWNGNSESLVVNLSVLGGGEISQSSITNTKGAWTTYEVWLTGLTNASKVKFEAANSSNNRFFLDEVMIVEAGELDLAAKAGETYYATFSSENDVEFADDVVYTVSVNGSSISLDKVESKQVPAYTGVLIQTTSNKAAYKYIETAAEFRDKNKENKLVPASVEMSDKNKNYYKLAYANWNGSVESSTGLGFHYGADNGAPFVCKDNTAYLAVPNGTVPNSPAVKSFVFGEDDEDAINAVMADNGQQAAEIYNLNGQRVSKMQKGINIVNGKKYVVK